jgi:hypothetical protein
MPIGNWNLQWLNHNAQRSYPLTARASKQDVSGTFTIPDSFIVALYFPINSNTTFTPGGFFISSILLSPAGFNIVIGYTDGQTVQRKVAAANIARANYVPNTAYSLAGVNDFYDSIGFIVLGELDEIDKQPVGLFEFDIAGAEIESDAIRPMLRAVSSLRVFNNNEYSDRIYGDVTLVAGANVRIVTSVSGNVTFITIDAISGENLNQTCLCDIVKTGPCVTSINGIHTIDGNFVLSPGTCTSLVEIQNGLKIEDTCAKPCCGCSELDALRTQVDRFGDGITTLQNFVTRLGSEVTQMSLVIMGSRLGSSSCTQG